MNKEDKWTIGQEKWNKIRRLFILETETKEYKTPHTNFLENLYNDKEELTLQNPLVLEVLSDLLYSYSSLDEFREALDRRIKELRQ
jgi:hypothetical protein